MYWHPVYQPKNSLTNPTFSSLIPQSTSDYRQALADALRAVVAAGEALVALAEALEQPQTAQWPHEDRRAPQGNVLNGQVSTFAPHLNGTDHLAR